MAWAISAAVTASAVQPQYEEKKPRGLRAGAILEWVVYQAATAAIALAT